MGERSTACHWKITRRAPEDPSLSRAFQQADLQPDNTGAGKLESLMAPNDSINQAARSELSPMPYLEPLLEAQTEQNVGRNHRADKS